MSNISSPTSKSPTPHSSPDVVPSSPRPRHFISRSDGTLTPLIAVDELPDSVRLVGIPVVLCNADTQGMVSLGVQARSHGRYIAETPNESLVDAPNEPFPVNSKVSEERSKESNTAECFEDLDTVSVKRSPASETVQRSEDQNTSEHGVEKWRQEISTAEETQATIDAVIAANAEPTKTPRIYKPSTPGVFGKKIYCTHWLRTGECDFTQQGCMYKHEMPDDKTLAALNFRGVPRWYREAHGVPVPLNSFNQRPAVTEGPWRAQSTSKAIEHPKAANPFRFNPMRPSYTRNTTPNQQYNSTDITSPFRAYNGDNHLSATMRHSSGTVGHEFPQPQMWNSPAMNDSFVSGFSLPGHPLSSMGFQQMASHGQRSSTPMRSTAPATAIANDFTSKRPFDPSFDQMATSAPLERGLSNYHPLTPSPPCRHSAAKRANPFPQPKPAINPANLFDGAPPTPAPLHRRLFVPPGELSYVASPSLGPSDRTGGLQEKFDALLKDKSIRASKAHSKNTVGNLLDLTDN